MPFFNRCIDESRFPPVWKDVTVVPIFKSADKTQVNNYRPISLSSNLLKTFERCIFSRMSKFINENKIIPDCQFGFRTHRSVGDQLVCTLDFLTKGINQGKSVLGVYFDFQKAFDKIPNYLLIQKLERIWFSGKSLKP